MINLAGVPAANYRIREELFLAGIPTHPEKSTGEVLYTHIGKLLDWTFRRAWYYYVASCNEQNGLIYDAAVRLHESEYPVPDENYHILGEVIRVNGHCGCPHPKEGRYPSLADIETEFVGSRAEFPKIDFDAGRAFKTSSLREINGVKYVRLYHIDTIVGLVAFANTLKTLR